MLSILELDLSKKLAFLVGCSVCSFSSVVANLVQCCAFMFVLLAMLMVALSGLYEV